MEIKYHIDWCAQPSVWKHTLEATDKDGNVIEEMEYTIDKSIPIEWLKNMIARLEEKGK